MRGRLINVETRCQGSELAVAVPRIANYLWNPSFQFATTQWLAAGTGVSIARQTTVKMPGFAGALSLTMANPGATSDRVEQAINFTAGDAYIFRGFARAVAGQNHRFWVVDNLSVNLGQQSQIADGGFQYFEVPFTATANNSHKVRYGRVGTGDPGGLWYLQFAQVIRVADGAVLPILPYATPEFGAPFAWQSTVETSPTIAPGILEVADPTDFEEAGWVLVGDDDLHPQLEAIEYVSVDDDTGVLICNANLANAYAAGEAVLQYPVASDRVAHVLVDDGDESVPAVVPHFLYDRVPVGTRSGEGETIELGWNDNVLIVSDVIGSEPANDAAFLDFGEAETGWQMFCEMFEINSTMLEGSIVGDGLVLTLGGTGANGLQLTATTGHPGTAELATGTTTTGRAQVRTALRVLDVMNGQQRFGGLMAVPVLPGATNDFEAHLGFIDSDTGWQSPAGANDAAGFRVHNGVANWQCFTNDGGSPITTFDSGVPVVAGQYYLLEVVMNIPLGWVQFYIDNVLVATSTTDLPTGFVNYQAGIQKTTGTTSRSVYIDYLYGDGVVSRGGSSAPIRIATGTGKTILTRTLVR